MTWWFMVVPSVSADWDSHSVPPPFPCSSLPSSVVSCPPRPQHWQAWVGQHWFALGLVILVSVAHTGIARLISSGILGVRALSAPLSEAADLRLQMFGLVSLFLEDFPQMVLQIRVIADEERFESAAVIALLFSVLALVFGLGKRGWLWWSADQESRAGSDITMNAIGGSARKTSPGAAEGGERPLEAEMAPMDPRMEPTEDPENPQLRQASHQRTKSVTKSKSQAHRRDRSSRE